MNPPVRHLSPQLIQDHPPLKALSDFIQEKSGHAPEPGDIHVSNGQENDGFIDLNYYGRDGHLFLTRLNAYERFLQVNEGKVQNGKPNWSAPVKIPVADACRTLHDLGGDQEAQVQCADSPIPNPTSSHAQWWALVGGGSLGLAEGAGWALQRRSLSLALARYLKPNVTFNAALRPTWMEGARHGLSSGLGLLAMWGTERFANGLGILHPHDHSNERWALDTGVGYGVYRLSNKLPLLPMLGGLVGGAVADQTVGRAFKNHTAFRVSLDVGATYVSYRLGKYFLKRWGLKDPRIQSTPFVASLLSASLLDTTLGRFFDKDSNERKFIRETGFFLPQLYQTVMGPKSLVLSESAGAKLFTKWGERVVLAGFVADLGYMGYNLASNGSSGSARVNRLYSRAQELYEPEQYAVTSFLSGAMHILAPALTERLFVPNSYVVKARQEMQEKSMQYFTQIGGGLQKHFHYLGLESPENRETWTGDSLRGENVLKNFVGPEGRELPLEAVAEQLAFPKIYETRVQGKSEEEVVAYIRRQYRGWKLSEGETRAILDRLQLYYTREMIKEYPDFAEPEAQALLKYFDAAGNLKPGLEKELVDSLVPKTEALPQS